ncbi:MAG: PP2C family protein-serine/threonine phosphatase [Mariprofundaceae bacterium]|nr:PP2C family protein-serine/threonine phosphatase [Mariprofundaceae bacterium]
MYPRSANSLRPLPPLARYLLSLWPLLIFFTVVQGVMWANGNSDFLGLPYWISDFDMLLFVLCFSSAGLWTYRPLFGVDPAGVEYAGRIARLPLRALKAFAVGGFTYGGYLLLLVLNTAASSGVHLSGLMLLSLLLSLLFCALVLVPALGVIITLHHGVQQRLLHPRRSDIRQQRLWNPLHVFTDSTRRPWLVFLITGMAPSSLLVLFAYLASLEETAGGQHFIAGQGLLLFVAGSLASVCLVWLVTRSLKLVTTQLSIGLHHLRKGRFDGQIAVLSDDDLGELAHGLNHALIGLQEREEIKGSLAVAAEIQRGLLPLLPDDVPDYAFAAAQRSCHSVGGDYYDMIRLPDGRFWLVMADVAGKGYPAALTVANLQAMLHVLAEQNVPFEEAIAYINRSLCRTLTQGRFVTLFMAKLQPESHSMLWLNAGHVPPFLQDGEGEGDIRKLKAGTPPLGMLPELEFEVQREELAPGARMLIYTDGVTEMQAAGEGRCSVRRP